MNPEIGKMLHDVIAQRLHSNRAARRRAAAKLEIPWEERINAEPEGTKETQ